MRIRVRLLAFVLVLNSSCVSKSCTELRGPMPIIGQNQKILTPFPSDRLTVPDPTTPTKLRVDLPVKDDATELEKLLTSHANKMDGFGVSSPICVRFDMAVDLASITQNSCYLVPVDTAEPVALDIGDGNFPINLARPLELFPNEVQYPSMLLPPENRTRGYEDSTNCLILRPKSPLRPAMRYVVILTRKIRGENGDPIEAPPNEPPLQHEFDDFAQVAPRLGLDPIDVAFYWTFTTHSVSRDLETIRAGQDGQGVLSSLATNFPAKMKDLHDLKYGLLDGNPYTMDAPVAGALFEILHQLAQVVKPIYPGLADLTGTFRAFIADLSNVDYFVFGSFDSPSFISTGDGLFDLDPFRGTATVKPARVPFMLTIPKPTAENNYAQAPYPVVVHGHGLTVSRLQAWPMANRMAAKGIAGACMDLVAHGPMAQFYMIPKIFRDIEEPYATLAKPIIFSLGLLIGVPVNPFDPLSEMVDKVFSSGMLAPITGDGRATDVDGDGDLDPTVAFFSSDFFQMRDNIRQCVVDQMQFVRMLRNLGKDWNGNGKIDKVEGDINGDGKVDLGGPTVELTYAGVSLGSIIGGIVMAVDPQLRTGVLNVAGGGLGDIMFRTTVLNEVFVTHVIRDVFGLAIVGRPDGTVMKLTWNNEPKEKAFWSVPPTSKGRVEIRNWTKGHVYHATYGPECTFSVVMQADKGDDISVAIFPEGYNVQVQRREFKAPYSGLGVSRGTTRAREFMMLLTWFLETADPIAYAQCWWQRPLEGVPAKNILMQLACDDPVVPVGSGISLARAAGLVSPGRMTELIAKGLPEGAVLAFDKDAPVESDQFRALRFHASGKHAYIIGGNNKDIEKSVELGMAAQNQMAEFLRTDGAFILTDPAFDYVLPDDNGQLLFDIPLPFGINPPP